MNQSAPDLIDDIIDRVHDESHTLQHLGLHVQRLGLVIESDDFHDPVPVAKRLEKLREYRAALESAARKYENRCEALQRARDLAAADTDPLSLSA